MSIKLPDWLPKKWLYRPDEVADFLGLSVSTVRRRMNCGDFGGLHREEGGMRITIFGLVGYLEARRVAPDDLDMIPD